MTASRRELLPVLVHGLGRSGTTLLMQLLGTSPQVAFDRAPPCENRYLTYLVRLCRLLDPNHPREASWHQDAMMHDLDGRVGPPPWSDPALLRTGAEDAPFAMLALRSVWSTFSEVAARNTRPEAPASVRYYAEKAPRWLVRALPVLGGGRALHLVRDPRDVYMSVLAFNRRRGYAAFGRNEGMSDDDYLAIFLATQCEFLADVAALQDTDTSLRVRYEDLVADLGQEAVRIGGWLGITLDPDAVLQARPRLRDHTTSSSPQASVGRWRKGMPAATVERFAVELGDSLRALGYA